VAPATALAGIDLEALPLLGLQASDAARSDDVV
jgi:hypothetical protein